MTRASRSGSAPRTPRRRPPRPARAPPPPDPPPPDPAPSRSLHRDRPGRISLAQAVPAGVADWCVLPIGHWQAAVRGGPAEPRGAAVARCAASGSCAPGPGTRLLTASCRQTSPSRGRRWLSTASLRDGVSSSAEPACGAGSFPLCCRSSRAAGGAGGSGSVSAGGICTSLTLRALCGGLSPSLLWLARTALR